MAISVVIWVIPGPILGIGLKQSIAWILDITHSEFLADLLYYGPSPIPMIWAFVIRFFPAAVAMLWPVVRMLPRELLESARVDGATPGHEFRLVVWPLTRWSWVMAALASATLAMGELSASKLAETPGSQSFAHAVFTQMHFGVTNDLAALCLVHLLAIIGCFTLFAIVSHLRTKPAPSI